MNLWQALFDPGLEGGGGSRYQIDWVRLRYAGRMRGNALMRDYYISSCSQAWYLCFCLRALARPTAEVAEMPKSEIKSEIIILDWESSDRLQTRPLLSNCLFWQKLITLRCGASLNTICTHHCCHLAWTVLLDWSSESHASVCSRFRVWAVKLKGPIRFLCANLARQLTLQAPN